MDRSVKNYNSRGDFQVKLSTIKYKELKTLLNLIV